MDSLQVNYIAFRHKLHCDDNNYILNDGGKWRWLSIIVYYLCLFAWYSQAKSSSNRPGRRGAISWRSPTASYKTGKQGTSSSSTIAYPTIQTNPLNLSRNPYSYRASLEWRASRMHNFPSPRKRECTSWGARLIPIDNCGWPAWIYSLIRS